MVTDGYWTYHGDQFIRHINGELLWCAPETNIVLDVNSN